MVSFVASVYTRVIRDISTILARADAVAAAGVDDIAVDRDRAFARVPLAAADARAGTANGRDAAAVYDDGAGARHSCRQYARPGPGSP